MNIIDCGHTFFADSDDQIPDPDPRLAGRAVGIDRYHLYGRVMLELMKSDNPSIQLTNMAKNA